ncbi:winged helix-turn-helix transcriptional regulator [Kutzneria sp. CA-103260]|uniref:winged helix-turn-helix transcriptional regulator n=1 Tax=Kutzneria sp. CA-103260 TaxID=2802641 RepID=UPI001BA571EA|nr:winged helix-turn-helix transcriptional regulator [Kutzneria sp. CA-103260]QUQ68710.1 HxlR-like helix-turn-helix [Kutzneria sp. CA-103260]
MKSTNATEAHWDSEWPDEGTVAVPATYLVNWAEVAEVIGIVALRSALAVLVALGHGPVRYSELSRTLHMDNKQLSRVLRRLREAQIVAREVNGVRRPIQVRYHLTPSGQNLMAILAELESWRLPRG